MVRVSVIKQVLIAATVVLLAASATAAAQLQPATARLDGMRVRQLGSVLVKAMQVPGVDVGWQYFPQSVASGDPRPDSVILWTRVDDPAVTSGDIPLRLIVTKDKYFNNVVYNDVVTAKAANDRCVKIKIGGLQAGTTYLYFFVYTKGGTQYLSRLGRTKTAPAAGSNVPVKFAYVTCQDFIGRYYNTYARMLLDHKDDLDFLVHLGDYVYETTGNPSFQTPTSTRKVVFTDTAGAIKLGDPENPYYAAASLSNYRELYKTYRSDVMLQLVHELYPMIVMWDDHEYADDAWGDVATYFSGRANEKNTARKRNAERAYFEYLPIDYGLDATGQLAITDSILYPNVKIYRDFRWGANLHLVLTDARSFRPDHTVPEDAFPGKVVLDKATLEAALGAPVYAAIKGGLDPYLNVDTNPVLQGTLAAILAQLYQLNNPALTPAEAVAKAQAAASGNVSANYINALFAAIGYPAPIDAATMAVLDRGLSYLFVGKQDLYSMAGSRYMLAKDGYDLLAAVLYGATGGASQNVLGTTQQAWLQNTLKASTATWKVLGNSFSSTPMVVDFTNPLIAAILPPDFPDAFRTRLLLDADQWDGFPQKRAEILGLLATVPNSVIISGDIHASFVADLGGGVFEFTGSSVSAQVFGEMVLNTVLDNPILGNVQGIEQVVAMLGPLLQLSLADPAHAAPEIYYDNLTDNAFVLVDVKPENLTATYYMIPEEHVFTSYYTNPNALNSLFKVKSFKVQGGKLTPLQ